MSFEGLNKTFTSASVLAHVDPQKPFIIEANASNFTLCSIFVESQAQHRPDRLCKPRTGSVGTDRLGQTGAYTSAQRGVVAMREPRGRWKDIPRRNIFWS